MQVFIRHLYAKEFHALAVQMLLVDLTVRTAAEDCEIKSLRC